jgi:hypothetical protein
MKTTKNTSVTLDPTKNSVKLEPIKATEIKSFADLKGRLEKPVNCYFRLDSELVSLPVKRVSPRLAERIRQMRRSVTPTWKKERGPSGDYDPMDPAYLKLRDEIEAQVRALIVYTCCPFVAQEKAGLENPVEIEVFVKSIWTENILDLVMVTAQAGGISLDEEVQRRGNFTSTPGLES